MPLSLYQDNLPARFFLLRRAGSCWCCRANLIAYQLIEEGIKRDCLYLLRKAVAAPWGSVSVRRRRQGGIADVSKASRFIPSSSDPHSASPRATSYRARRRRRARR